MDSRCWPRSPFSLFPLFVVFLARRHWVREEAVDGQGVVVEEHVLGSGVVEEVEVVPAGVVSEGDGGGGQQDGGRAPTEVGLPALCFLSHFHISLLFK